MKTGQTPLEALQARKRQLRFDAQIQEDKIGANIKYMQYNGTRLILHSVAAALIPGKSTTTNHPSGSSTQSSGLADLAIGGVSAFMKGNKGILPMLWGIAQPFVLTWGIKGIKKLFRRSKR